MALYGEGGHHWAMTERGKRSMSRRGDVFSLGRSRLVWSADGLVIDIDERLTPSHRPLLGHITLTPQRGGGPAVALDRDGLHGWRPVAPDCQAKVRLSAPNQTWSGHGYIDTNWGERPIARDFTGWDWSRTCGATPRAFYELTMRNGDSRAFGAAFGADGVFRVGATVPHAAATPTFWRIPRRLPGEAGVIAGTLEDTPFYARSLARSAFDGDEQMLIHERLDCRRLASPWVQALLPFRMPREG